MTPPVLPGTSTVLSPLIDTEDALIARNPAAGSHRLSLLDNIFVERGTMDDWKLLCELHYKGHTLAAGSRFMRCVVDHGDRCETIGVLVIANPRPLDRDRMRIFPATKPNQEGLDTRLMNTRRMAWINANIGWNNRTVLDTMYRSAGIAYRFKNLAYRMYCCEYGHQFIESRSSMGKFNPFSIKSGMRFTPPTAANAHDEGVRFFTGHFKSSPHDLVAMKTEMAAMPEYERTFVESALRAFYYRHSSMEKSGDKRSLGTTRVDGLDLDYIFRQLMQLCFGETIYWIWGPNPDKGRELPKRLPLLQFDRQPLNAALVLP